jgi:hypothetical protein
MTGTKFNNAMYWSGGFPEWDFRFPGFPLPRQLRELGSSLSIMFKPNGFTSSSHCNQQELRQFTAITNKQPAVGGIYGQSACIRQYQ